MYEVNWIDHLGIKQHVGLATTFEEECGYDFVPSLAIVCVLGHIDHGKTSLIDSITYKKITSYESGFITQRIRVSTYKHRGTRLTFIDTPGHSLFSEVRLNCLHVSNISMLVVSLQEGPRTQTIESAKQINQLGLPVLIVYNKLDCRTSKIEENIVKTRIELTKVGIVPEITGGNAIEVQVSAKSNENIKQLLDILCSMIDKIRLKSNISSLSIGIVIDVKLAKGLRPIVNVLVSQGILKCGQVVTFGSNIFNIYFESDIQFVTAVCTTELIGLPINIQPGQYINSNQYGIMQIKRSNVGSFQQNGCLIKKINVIIKADSFSSLNGIIHLTNELKLTPIWTGIGHISLANVSLALATKSVLIAFNVKIITNVKRIAKQSNVIILSSELIYELVQWLRDLITRRQMLQTVAQVEKIFQSKWDTIYGAKLVYGKVFVDQRLVIIRQEQLLFTIKIKTLKRFCSTVKLFSEVNQLFGFAIHEEKDIKLNDKLAYQIL
ncbi:Translation initiation factor IF-2 [Candidatus Hodgkinia cicadicola]|uniref:Translation initiation factor IF-2 n=1 Tax=Candidatus Hodgkinia cicadicola TaxID=573658 RepID=A0ABX4MFK8_9HYPH|nr:Translation initiation factor IF-2 [Candidatus Hodgkinia cicadicola]PIM96717.1 Translation initiation factor IF-2 [Candidatus Hodgkinia cicadicola]